MYPGGIAGGVVERFAWCLDKIDAKQADDGDSGDEQNGGAYRTQPAPGCINRVPQHVGEALVQAARLAGVLFVCASSGRHCRCK